MNHLSNFVKKLATFATRVAIVRGKVKDKALKMQ